MKLHELPLPGAYRIDLEPIEDERGSFTRVFCRQELAAQGLEGEIAQASLSFNHKRGTLRGLHFQAAPHEEAKIVRCTAGEIFDVIVDLRPLSPTFRQSCSMTLSSHARQQLYVPKGFAHGFQTLVDDTEVAYFISTPYEPSAARGYRFDDPAFGIRWPLPVAVISERDATLPLFGAEGERRP
ncbi:MAG TPA: dTDP-4-dehydrorhamnose 3,5-epimerase family protein [Thermoanaerobaculia bacterium]|nr:dTDP-4-dehydrorhamnose 3,5-epimerase family protein [Thermoanaerobaculia bacterium]